MVSLPLEAFIKGLTQGDLCQAVHRDAVFVLQNLASHRWLSQFNSDTINKNEFYFPKIQKSLLLHGTISQDGPGGQESMLSQDVLTFTRTE